MMLAFILSLLALLPFYAMGSFPTGYLISKRKGVNIGSVGSGNVGATNVLRALGRKAGFVTLLGDIAKGAFAVLIAKVFSADPSFSSYAGLAAVAGHCFSFPPFLKGGKGVATGLGVFLALSPLTAIFGVAISALVYRFSGIVSLACLVSSLVSPIFAMFYGAPDSTLFSMAGIVFIIFYRHRANLERLVQGVEPRTAM